METVGKYIVEKIRERSQTQGHTLTGKFEAGISYKVVKDGNTISIIGYDESEVGKYLDTPTPASRIPFSPGSGATKSLFIDGLKSYAQKRFGLSGKAALGAAFGIAHNMKKQGKPTRGSYQFTRNGRRTGVITDILRTERDNITKLINQEMGGIIRIDLTNLIRKYSKQWQ